MNYRPELCSGLFACPRMTVTDGDTLYSIPNPSRTWNGKVEIRFAGDYLQMGLQEIKKIAGISRRILV